MYFKIIYCENERKLTVVSDMPIIWPTYDGPAEDEEHKVIESKAHEKLFDYIRPDVLDNPQLVRFTEISQERLFYAKFRRKIDQRVDQNSLPQKTCLLSQNSLLAKGVVQHSQRQMTASSSSGTKAFHQVVLDIRGSIRSSKNNMPCTPRQSEQSHSMCPQTVQRLLNSFVQDLVFGVIGGRIKTPHTYCYHTPSHHSPIIPISFRLLIGVGMVCLTHNWSN